MAEDGPGITTSFQSAELAGACYSAVSKDLHPAIEADLIDIALEARDDGALAVRILPGNNCGFVSIVDRLVGQEISIEIIPKINAANIFSLLALSGSPERFLREHESNVAESQNAPLIQLLGTAYGSALQHLLRRGGLRGLHETKCDRLPFRVRGRVNIGQYLHEYSVGRQHVFPCTYPTHTLDNKVNRLLRWALHAISSACRNSGAIPAALEKLDSAFAGVALDATAPTTDSAIGRLPNAFDHYWDTGAIQLAKLIARGSNLGAVGGMLRSRAIAMPMHVIFEAAFARVIAGLFKLPLERISQQQWQIIATRNEVGEKGGTFIPDIVLPPQPGRFGVVADTKWKSGIDRGLEHDFGKVLLRAPGIKLYNADIYQMLGYISAAREIHGAEFIGVIVYPVANAEGADLSPLRIYVGSGRSPMPVYLLPWEVGKRCFECLPELWNEIECLRSMNPAQHLSVSTAHSSNSPFGAHPSKSSASVQRESFL